nr:MAG TPA: hypothetical protein [Bacteriophage sp.]
MLCFGLFSIANRIFPRAPVVECLRREPNFQNCEGRRLFYFGK